MYFSVNYNVSGHGTNYEFAVCITCIECIHNVGGQIDGIQKCTVPFSQNVQPANTPVRHTSTQLIAQRLRPGAWLWLSFLFAQKSVALRTWTARRSEHASISCASIRASTPTCARPIRSARWTTTIPFASRVCTFKECCLSAICITNHELDETFESYSVPVPKQRQLSGSVHLRWMSVHNQ